MTNLCSFCVRKKFSVSCSVLQRKRTLVSCSVSGERKCQSRAVSGSNVSLVLCRGEKENVNIALCRG